MKLLRYEMRCDGRKCDVTSTGVDLATDDYWKHVHLPTGPEYHLCPQCYLDLEMSFKVVAE